ncbi:MAG: hypothetical protein EZS28_004574 [Streblomastix strix]|uniref:Uncharacterized protein n=1 Tax=Streblomastix strix TaxID=222440 RepID=A0A5J4X0B4_9EUKA|nr:MAG: hypothetical protein EZS28_004574 [Streblomastix strix]
MVDEDHDKENSIIQQASSLQIICPDIIQWRTTGLLCLLALIRHGFEISSPSSSNNQTSTVPLQRLAAIARKSSIGEWATAVLCVSKSRNIIDAASAVLTALDDENKDLIIKNKAINKAKTKKKALIQNIKQ